MIKVFIAGATGWTGSEISKAVFGHKEMKLVGGLSSKHNGENLADVLNLGEKDIPLFENIDQALNSIDFDVMVEFTQPGLAKRNVMAAIKKGKSVVIGTSGLTTDDYAEIESAANENNIAVLAAGNFAMTAVLLQKFATIAAKYIPHYEVIDYASDQKKDTPSGSVAELVQRLAQVQQPVIPIPTNELIGVKETRGASIHGIQVHSVRLPGHVLGIETIFGLKDEKLTIRHDAGSSAEPYVQGVLLAIKKLNTFKGLRKGLDTIMEF